MYQYFNAAQGLKKMFIAQIGIIICTVCVLIAATGTFFFVAAGSAGLVFLFGLLTFVAAIGIIVFYIINLIGIYGAGKDIKGCKTAFMLTIVNLVVNVIERGLNSFVKLKREWAAGYDISVLSSLSNLSYIFKIAGTVFLILTTFYVCKSVATVMLSIGAKDVSAMGENVWKITLVCNIVSIVIIIRSLILGIGMITTAFLIVAGIISLVALIMYIIFLYKSYHALGA